MLGCRPGKARYQTDLVDPETEPSRPSPISDYWIASATWSAFGDVTGEGLDLSPKDASGLSLLSSS